MIESSRVKVPAGAAGEFSSPRSTSCDDSYFGIRTCDDKESKIDWLFISKLELDFYPMNWRLVSWKEHLHTSTRL